MENMNWTLSILKKGEKMVKNIERKEVGSPLAYIDLFVLGRDSFDSIKDKIWLDIKRNITGRVHETVIDHLCVPIRMTTNEIKSGIKSMMNAPI